MNVNSLNTISAMQKVSNAPAFKACGCEKATTTPTKEANLTGLYALGSIAQPCIHTTTLSFDESGKKLAVSSGISTIDNSQQKECSSVELDRKEGQKTSTIIESFIKQSPNIGGCSVKFTDGSEATIYASSYKKADFETVLTNKNGESQIIHKYTKDSSIGKLDMDAYKDAIRTSIASIGFNDVKSITISAQK